METHEESPSKQSAIIGCLLGTAVGDAIGLPCERLSKQRQRRLFGEIKGPRFVFGRGMISDDTEHACMTAQALIVSAGDVTQFTQSLAQQLRLWLLALPPGTGLATLKATLKLWLGFPPDRSGVFSAGNGPAMRSPIIGVCWGHDGQVLRALVRASTRLTHTDLKAEWGSVAVALAAHRAAIGEHTTPQEYLQALHNILDDEADELLELIDKAVVSANAGHSTEAFAQELGLASGVTGYIYHTVPVVLHAWFRHQNDYRTAILEIVHCGGDTDSTAAILGGIIGAAVGPIGIPQEWRDALWEWPRSEGWMAKLGKRLAAVCLQGTAQSALPLSFAGTVVRNLIFLLIVLVHGLRRLLPPY
jgi:ADP-ribosyl-[dinitrogen reductase] hydrolase